MVVRKQHGRLAAGVTAAVLLASCASGTHRLTAKPAAAAMTSAPAPSTTATPSTPRRARPTTTAAATTAPTSTAPATAAPGTPAPAPSATPAPTAAPPPVLVPGAWTPLRTSGTAVVEWATTVNTDGATVTLVKMDGARVHLSLQPPWQFPNSIRPKIVAAFNGGFQYPSGDSGFRIGGSVSGTFNAGMAAIVGYTNGAVKLGQWGRDVPGPAPVAWARSNLQLLVDGGAPSGQIGNLGAWGAPLQSLGQGYNVARSSLGVDAAGNLVYAGCSACFPVALAHALVAQGAVRAMQLDINPWWVMFMSYAGGAPTSVINVNHGADQFDAWGRDFFVGQIA